MFLLFMLTINACRFMETIKNNSPSGTGRTMIGIGKPKRTTSLYSYVMPSRESFVPINSAQKVNRMKWPGIDYCGLYLLGEPSRRPNRPLLLCYDLLLVAVSSRLCSSSPGRGSQQKEEEKTINYPTHTRSLMFICVQLRRIWSPRIHTRNAKSPNPPLYSVTSALDPL